MKKKTNTGDARDYQRNEAYNCETKNQQSLELMAGVQLHAHTHTPLPPQSCPRKQGATRERNQERINQKRTTSLSTATTAHHNSPEGLFWPNTTGNTDEEEMQKRRANTQNKDADQ